MIQRFSTRRRGMKDVCLRVAMGEEEKARREIDAVPERHPFEVRYDRIEAVPWETCAEVLDSTARRKELVKVWA